MKVNGKENDCHILKDLPDGLSIERRMLSMLTGIKFEDLGEALAQTEEDQDEKDTGEFHAMVAYLRPQGSGQGGRGGGAKGEKGSRFGRGKFVKGRH